MLDTNVESSRARLLAAVANTPDLVFIRAFGNLGDELIYAGTRQLLAGRPYREVDILKLHGVRGHTALVAGSGGWCQTYQAMPGFLAQIEAQFERVIILPSSFEVSVTSVHRALERTKAHVFAREAESYRQIREICHADLAHDCAFFFDYAPYRHLGTGHLDAFRTDAEAAGTPVPPGNIDISVACASLDNWLWTIARHASLGTDRAHVAIAGALLGKQVHCRASNYHKVPAIVAFALQQYPVTLLPTRLSEPALSNPAVVTPRLTEPETRLRLDALAETARHKLSPAFWQRPREQNLTVIVLSHERLDQTLNALRALKAHIAVPFKLVLVDNASSAATRAQLSLALGEFQDAALIQSEVNLGCAGGRVLGLEYANTPYVLFVDNDVEVMPGCVEHLLDVLETQPGVAAASAQLVFPDGQVHLCGGDYRVEGDGIRLALSGLGQALDGAGTEPSGPCRWVNGGCTLFRRAVLEAEPFDRQMRAYYEDFEWCYRLRSESGISFYRCVEALGLHHHATKQPAPAESPEHQRQHAARYLDTLAYFHQKHGKVLLNLFAFVPELGVPTQANLPAAKLLLELVDARGSAWLLEQWQAGQLAPLFSRQTDRAPQWEQRVQQLAERIALQQQSITTLGARLEDAERVLQLTTTSLAEKERALQAAQYDLALIHGARYWKALAVYRQARRGLFRALAWPYRLLRRALKAVLPLPVRHRLRAWVDRRRSAPLIPFLPARPAASRPRDYPPARSFDVLCFPIIDWEFRFQRPQQLILQFARARHRCFYLRLRFGAAGGEPRVERLAEGVYSVGLPGPAQLDPYAGQLSAAAVEQVLAGLDALRHEAGLLDVVCLVQLPFWGPLALAARERWGWKVVYDCLDDHSGFANVGAAVVANEAPLVALADLTLATSHALLRKVAPAARQTRLVPNAGDFDHFSQPPAARPLAHLSHPIIGYYGAIAEWFDVDLVRRAALARPAWQFVLIGHTFGADLAGLRPLSNVHLLGEKPYAELPGYLQDFDVALIPFKVTPLTLATNPVKFYEYLSAGKPMVAIELPELEPYGALYYAAHTAEAFVDQCELALREDSPDRAAARKAFARQQTWAHRCGDLQPVLPALFGRAVILIVSYGNLAYLQQCLDSVFSRTSYPNFGVVVVDNGSGPEIASYLTGLAAREPRLQVVLNAENEGFARANNQGLAAAGACEYVVLLNNDTVVTHGWLSGLVDYLRHPQVGLVGPVTNAIGNEAQVDLGPYALEDLEQVAAAYTQAHPGEVFDIPVLAMFCVGLRRALWDEVGPLDERFVVGMFEDDDFALRVRRAGYRVICANDIFVHHWMRAAFKALPPADYDALFAANKARFEAKWGQAWQPHQRRARSAARVQAARVLPNVVAWRCNICGGACQTPLAALTREQPSCAVCRSSVRRRSLIHLLSTALFGESLALPDFPERPDLRGLGLSDWEALGIPLARKLSFTNTYFHQKPRMDITAIDPALEGTLDFLIASEVFEHIAPPVAPAFENARRLLKPGGVLVFSAPYGPAGETVEHFPELHNYQVIEQHGRPVLRNVTRDGREQIADGLVFHDGDGTTVEMRLFSEAGLRASLAEAGFDQVRFHGEPFFAHGIYWPQAWSLPLTARPGYQALNRANLARY